MNQSQSLEMSQQKLLHNVQKAVKALENKKGVHVQFNNGACLDNMLLVYAEMQELFCEMGIGEVCSMFIEMIELILISDNGNYYVQPGDKKNELGYPDTLKIDNKFFSTTFFNIRQLSKRLTKVAELIDAVDDQNNLFEKQAMKRD